jgi:hypothetical protein
VVDVVGRQEELEVVLVGPAAIFRAPVSHDPQHRQVMLIMERQHPVPADTRVFTHATLKLIMGGKLERNAARSISKLLKPGTTYLEVGAGIGFQPAVIAANRLVSLYCARRGPCACPNRSASLGYERADADNRVADPVR